MSAEGTLTAILEWVDAVDGVPSTTLARFAIHLDDMPIWPIWGDDTTDLEVFVDDLLSFLAENWDELNLREVYPHGLNPDRPSRFHAAAERAAMLGPRNVQSEELMEATIAFARSHDLARAFGGLYGLPPLWLLRQGKRFLVETSDRLESVPMDSWLRFASEMGNRIADRLLASDSQKWMSLVNAWRARDCGDPVRIVALSTGQPQSTAQQLIADNLLPAMESITEAINDNDGLRVAARMVGPIPYHFVRSVLTAASAVTHRPSVQLDLLRTELSAAMKDRPEGAYPYEEGVHAATWIRGQIGLTPEARCDPIAVLQQYGVALLDQHVGPTTLDALAIWGEAHGPAVIFNLASKKLKRSNGQISGRARKILAAHELCHLVLDYQRTTAAVDILDSRMPAVSERRANAFAAELLLPAQTAAALWRRSDLPQTFDGVDKFLDRLRAGFDVSRIVAAWQLDHGLNGSNSEIVYILDELLDRR